VKPWSIEFRKSLAAVGTLPEFWARTSCREGSTTKQPVAVGDCTLCYRRTDGDVTEVGIQHSIMHCRLHEQNLYCIECIHRLWAAVYVSELFRFSEFYGPPGFTVQISSRLLFEESETTSASLPLKSDRKKPQTRTNRVRSVAE